MKLATAQQLKQSINEISTGNQNTKQPISQPKSTHSSRFSIVSDFLSVTARIEITAIITTKLWFGYEWLRSTQSQHHQSPARFILRDELFHRYQQSVEAVAKRIFRKVPSRSLVSESDLIDCSLLAHIEGLEKYSIQIGTTYMQYLNAPRGRSRIYGRCVDYMRKCQHLPRRIASERRELNPKIEALMHKLGKINISVEDVIDHYGDEAGSIMADPLFGAAVYNQELITDSSSTDEPATSQFDQHCKIPENCACVSSQNSYGGSQMNRETTDRCKYDGESMILSLIEDPDVRFVIWAYNYLGMVSSEIAEILGKSISTVALLKEKGYKTLRTKLTKEEMKEICHLVRYGD